MENITIEITEKERTALSILLGLRQKFAREKKEHTSYSAYEMHKLFSELIDKINKEELRFGDTIRQLNTPAMPQDEVWGEIDAAIERSTIKRYNWKEVFGNSLTEEILRIKNTGADVKETFETIKKDKRVINFIEQNKREKRKILENLKISVHARFGENQTADKLRRESNE